MLKSFLRLTLRLLGRQKFASFINIAGLTLGFASFILIGLYVYDELQFDRGQSNEASIYRIHSNMFNPERNMAHLPARFYPVIKDNLPEVREVVRTFKPYIHVFLSIDETLHREERLLFADPAFFEVFSFKADPASRAVFRETPNAIILGPSLAERIFGNEDPVGKLLRYNESFELVVAGVLAEDPEYSHLDFSAVINYDALNSINPFIFQVWGNFSSVYYLVLNEGAQAAEIGEKLKELYAEAVSDRFAAENYWMRLQAFRNIFFGSDQIETPFSVRSGNKSTVYIFSFSAIMILLLACFNYVNFATARSAARAREVGIRKVSGASRGHLIWYYLGESLLICFVSLLLAVGLVEGFSPLFSNLSGKEIHLGLIEIWKLCSALLALLLLVGLASGAYPSFVLARFQAVQVLKGSALFSGRERKGALGINLRLRQLLIVMQFAISIGLITGSLFFFKQIKHALAGSGFERESLVVVRNSGGNSHRQTYEAFRLRMEQYPFVTHVSAGGHVPTDQVGSQGYLRQPHQLQEESQLMYFCPVDFGYFETLGAQLSEGRFFDTSFHTDSTLAVVLNQTAVRMLELENPVGTMLTGFWDGIDKRVVGVVKDIHYESAHMQVRPIAFFPIYDYRFRINPATMQIMVRFSGNSAADVVQAITKVWEEVSPHNYPVEYAFMDSTYENLYVAEIQTGKIARVFTLIAILIAGMGLLGTTAYVMETRRKEFGIRKVLGASATSLIKLVSFEFSILIILANLIAWPVAYYLLSKWLENFVYRVELSVWTFAFAGLAGLLLALLVVNSLVINQAGKNPVESLKYE